MKASIWSAVASVGERPRRSCCIKFGVSPRPTIDGLRRVRPRNPATRDSKCFVSVSMAVAGRDVASEDPLIQRRPPAEHDRDTAPEGAST